MNNSSLMPRSMQGITLVSCGNRMFRVSTDSIPDKALPGISYISWTYNWYFYGSKGRMINKLKYETKTSIRAIPENDEIEIEGRKMNVEQAKLMIEQVVEKNKTLVRPSHFLSLPLFDPSVQHKVEKFQNDILSLKLPNIDPSIMIKPSSLHITIGMLNLYKQEDIEGAVKLLKTQANVLYSEVEDQDVITKLNEFLVPKFTIAGYMKNEDRPLKIHATIINTSHRRTEENGENKLYKPNYRKMERKPFSAVRILNNFSNIDFGISRIEEIHIAKIGVFNEQGRHRSEGKHKLP
ncbi:3130_t:CDS:2 [Diversispora eburnea]|uniref:3130_t:CDS:1 n=1 Tax=Diversispora eburnea TaxID=1213867 RepID=A0A9N9B9I3_9GLOM|nr:3130_t:CDS:2 [Diversispora eburnea]